MNPETNEPTQPITPSPYERGDQPAEQLAAEPQPSEATSAVTPATTPEPARYSRPSPYQTFAKPEEIKRESDNRTALGLENASIADVCKEWGMEIPLEFDSLAQGTLS